MPLNKCDKCNGTGLVVAGEASLENLLELFIQHIGSKLGKSPIPKLPSLSEPEEQFPNVVEKLHGKE